ncbi:MAG: molybdopterin cofactor-binding domain-containing protein [Elusimicrobiaceae bacterium]
MSSNETANFKTVNKRVTKVDALGLSCGKAEFADDISIPNMLHGKILWSPHAHARIKSIDTSAAEKVPGVKAVLTYKNVPAIRHTTAGQGYPEPSPYDSLIFDSKVRFVGDKVAAVAAETLEAATEAVSKIKVEYEILPAVFSITDAMKDGAPVIHDEKDAKNIPDPKHNVCAKFDLDINDGNWFKNADYVFENTYHTQYAQHCALEPHTTLAWLDPNGRLFIRTSTQVPFHVRRIVAQALNIPIKKIRVMKPRIGGGFGSKQEIFLEQVVSALVLATKQPVKIEFTRKEVFISSRTRHPSMTKLKTGVTKDGVITDMDMEIYINNGAYGAHALTVMMCAGSHSLPLYQARNNRFMGRTVYTNLPVAGAYRGYGATQAFFPTECQMDMMAEAIGMDPIEFRLKNYIKQGEGSPIFKAMGEGGEGVEQVITSCGIQKCIEKGLQEFKWSEKKKKYAAQTGTKRRGIGVACSMQGSGIPEVDMASATIKINDDGSFNLNLDATDIGTGSDTVLAQIAAEVLTVPTDKIIVYSSDTDLTPFDVGAYASSTTFISGNAVRKTAMLVRDMIIKVASSILNEKPENLRLENGFAVASDGKKKCSLAEVALSSLYFKHQHQICATASHTAHTSPPPFAAHFAEVEVDTETGELKVLDYVATVDCGTAINPALAEGQNDGAVMNGLSYALCEELEFNSKGAMVNPNFRSYRIFTAHDAPPVRSFLVPTYEPDGPFGAKSVSEIGINGPIPALSNAIYNATGARLFNPPFTPDKILRAIKEKGAKK